MKKGAADCRAPSKAKNTPSKRWAAPPAPAGEETDNQQHQENQQQNLCDHRSHPRERKKSQQSGYQRQKKKSQGPPKHAFHSIAVS
jgi:hypothetical protein